MNKWALWPFPLLNYMPNQGIRHQLSGMPVGPFAASDGIFSPFWNSIPDFSLDLAFGYFPLGLGLLDTSKRNGSNA